jgi:pyruvate,water dikinase
MVAAGVVCEIGAQGSHAAIVSRELGVPCVVSVPGATGHFRDGAVLTLDGAAGTVDVVEG